MGAGHGGWTTLDKVMNPKVAVFGTLRFPADRLPDVLPHLKNLVETTYKSDGCLAYDVALDAFDPGLIRFPNFGQIMRHLASTCLHHILTRGGGWHGVVA